MDNVLLLLRAPGQPEQVLGSILPYFRPARISHSYSFLLDESTVFLLDVRTGPTLYRCTGGIVTIKARGNMGGGAAARLTDSTPSQGSARRQTRRQQD